MNSVFPKEGETWLLQSPNGTAAEVHVVKVDMTKMKVGYTSQVSGAVQDIELHRFCAHFQPKHQSSAHA